MHLLHLTTNKKQSLINSEIEEEEVENNQMVVRTTAMSINEALMDPVKIPM